MEVSINGGVSATLTAAHWSPIQYAPWDPYIVQANVLTSAPPPGYNAGYLGADRTDTSELPNVNAPWSAIDQAAIASGSVDNFTPAPTIYQATPAATQLTSTTASSSSSDPADVPTGADPVTTYNLTSIALPTGGWHVVEQTA
jgi:hypothetical protein